MTKLPSWWLTVSMSFIWFILFEWSVFYELTRQLGEREELEFWGCLVVFYCSIGTWLYFLSWHCVSLLCLFIKPRLTETKSQRGFHFWMITDEKNILLQVKVIKSKSSKRSLVLSWKQEIIFFTLIWRTIIKIAAN